MLSVIIVSYNTKEILFNCLKNIEKIGLHIGNEIIVVDNASIDGSPEMVEQNYKNVILIKNAANKLFAKACNQGVQVAHGDYYLFLNSDAMPRKGHVEKLLLKLESGDKLLACVGPQVIYPDGRLQSEGHPIPSIQLTFANFFAVIKWPVSNDIKDKLLPTGYHRHRYGTTRNVGWVSGCCMLIKRSLWNQIGLFDEQLYFYNEDVEWCYRAKRKGFHIAVVPGAQVIHLAGASSRERISIERRMGLLKGEKYFYKCTQGHLYHLLNSGLILVLYPLPYLACRLFGLKFYAQASRRLIAKSLNTIRIILSIRI